MQVEYNLSECDHGLLAFVFISIECARADIHVALEKRPAHIDQIGCFVVDSIFCDSIVKSAATINWMRATQTPSLAAASFCSETTTSKTSLTIDMTSVLQLSIVARHCVGD